MEQSASGSADAEEKTSQVISAEFRDKVCQVVTVLPSSQWQLQENVSVHCQAAAKPREVGQVGGHDD